MGITVGAWDKTARLSSLGSVWLIELGTMGLAYAVIETGVDDLGPMQVGAVMVFLAGPFVLATSAIVVSWPLIRGNLSALAALWTLAGLVIGLALLAEGKAGAEITSLLILRRAIVLLGPYFLAGVTLFWLLERRGRRPS